MVKLFIIIPIVFVTLAAVALLGRNQQLAAIDSFEKCKAASSRILESYPSVCITEDGKRFVEPVDDNKTPATLSPAADIPSITQPTSGATVSSPLTVKGTVPPGWMFEGSLPIALLDENGVTIVEAAAHETTPGTWSSGSPVAFETKLTFTTNAKKGKILIKKDNPSGLPANNRSFELPVVFKHVEASSQEKACTTNDGTWDAQYRECTGITKAACETKGGKFNECDSACRHNPDRNAPCIMICVAVCQF